MIVHQYQTALLGHIGRRLGCPAFDHSGVSRLRPRYPVVREAILCTSCLPCGLPPGVHRRRLRAFSTSRFPTRVSESKPPETVRELGLPRAENGGFSGRVSQVSYELRIRPHINSRRNPHLYSGLRWMGAPSVTHCPCTIPALVCTAGFTIGKFPSEYYT